MSEELQKHSRALSAQEISALAMTLPDATLLVNPQFQVIWANRSAERLFGIQLADAADINGLDLIHPDDLEGAARSMNSVLQKDVGTPFEIRILAHDGWRLVEVIGAPLGGDLIVGLRDLTERRRWEIAHDEDAAVRSIIHNASMLTMFIDASGTVRTVSAAMTRILGHDQEWTEGRPFIEIVDPADSERWRRSLAQAQDPEAQPGSSIQLDLLLKHHDGSTIPFVLTVKNLLDDPTVNGLVVSGHDISVRVEAERALQSANSLLAATLESTADGILVVGQDLEVISFNSRFAKLWDIPDRLVESEDLDEVMQFVLQQLHEPEKFSPATITGGHHQEILELKDGRLFECDSLPQHIDGEMIGRVSSFRDVTEDRLLRNELQRMAFHDPLTGLPNRSLFSDQVDQAIRRSKRTRGSFAVLFIDLDNFKAVNDGLGHNGGDEVLRTTGDRLRSCLRSGDIAARMGGDEFAVLIEDLSEESNAIRMAERIVPLLMTPIEIGSELVTVGASVGVAIARVDEQLDGDALLHNADLAMYAAKSQGKSCYRLFEPEMAERSDKYLPAAGS